MRKRERERRIPSLLSYAKQSTTSATFPCTDIFVIRERKKFKEYIKRQLDHSFHHTNQRSHYISELSLHTGKRETLSSLILPIDRSIGRLSIKLGERLAQTFFSSSHLVFQMGSGASADANRLAKHSYFKTRHQKVLPSVEVEETYGKLLIIAASADGKISDKERQWVINSRASLGKFSLRSLRFIFMFDLLLLLQGVPNNVLNRLQKYNPTKDEAIKFLETEKEFIDLMRRPLIYDCCEMAACDGTFTGKERDLVEKIGKRLGVDQDVSNKIIKSYDEEHENRKKLVQLLFPQGVDTTIQSAADVKSKNVGRAS